MAMATAAIAVALPMQAVIYTLTVAISRKPCKTNFVTTDQQ